MEDSSIFKENVKMSFAKAKEHISSLEAEIGQIKGILEEIRSEIRTLKKAPKSEDSASQDEDFDESSIGNQGVPDSQRQPSDDNNRQQNDNKTPSDSQQTPKTLSGPSLSELKQSLDSAFRNLTDREFSVFMALYELEREMGGDIGYSDLSLRLKLSESTIRDFVNQLIRKNIPIQKFREFNKKVSLSVKEEFKHLDLYQKTTQSQGK